MNQQQPLLNPTIPAKNLKPGMRIVAPEHRNAVRTVARAQRMGSMTILEYRETMGGRTYPHTHMVEVAA